MRNLQTKKCLTCEKEFAQGYNISKKRWSETKFCSYFCRRFTLEARKKMSESTKKSVHTKRGVENPAWRGGLTPKYNILRGTLPLRLWRQNVNKRDENICQECGIVCLDGNRVAHHIVELKDRPDLGAIIENGLTLCIPCHRGIHAKSSEYKRQVMIEEVLKEIEVVYS
jgi:5-methylcytosine-specific restriction endonuclease McrA